MRPRSPEGSQTRRLLAGAAALGLAAVLALSAFKDKLPGWMGLGQNPEPNVPALDLAKNKLTDFPVDPAMIAAALEKYNCNFALSPAKNSTGFSREAGFAVIDRKLIGADPEIYRLHQVFSAFEEDIILAPFQIGRILVARENIAVVGIGRDRITGKIIGVRADEMQPGEETFDGPVIQDSLLGRDGLYATSQTLQAGLLCAALPERSFTPAEVVYGANNSTFFASDFFQRYVAGLPLPEEGEAP